MVKRKGTSNDLKNTTQYTKDWATETFLKIGDGLRCSGMVISPSTTSYTCRITCKWHNNEPNIILLGRSQRQSNETQK